MAKLKKIFAVLLIVILILGGCSKPNDNNSPTPTLTVTDGAQTPTPEGSEGTPTADATVTDGENVTATPTDEAGATVTATATANATATAKPTAKPTATPTAKPTATPGGMGYVPTKNLLDDKTSNFDGVTDVSQTKWSTLGAIDFSFEKNGSGHCMLFERDDTSKSYTSAMLDIAPYIKQAGTYTISFDYAIYGVGSETKAFQSIIRTDSPTSFSTEHNDGNCYVTFAFSGEVDEGEWAHMEFSFDVNTTDIGAGGKWNFGTHLVNENVEGICFDNVTLSTYTFEDEVSRTTTAQTWVANEDVFISEKWYDDAFHEVTMDLILTNGKVTYTIPCFWDGGKIWRARYALPSAGTWTYTTRSNVDDKGLNNQKSTIKCTNYSGSLDIYKHGFVKAVSGTRYFMYNDGTPFFYLGDTHWGFGGEPIDIVKTLADKRVEQNFTVLQSEPIGARFKVADGISSADIVGFREWDEKFQYLAEVGLVHANAQFFYPSDMQTLIANFGGYSTVSMGTTSKGNAYDLSDDAKAELELITRYWVARYAAYPVMWTLGQEVDDDFYWERSSHDEWSYVNNPYRLVADYISKYDPYKSPLSAHQENTGATRASDSAFRDVASHNFYAAQWSPSLTGGSLADVAKDYWEKGQGKVVVNYEGRYCYLWTKHFGARAQGWMAFLSGMYGYGYGAQDTWCYLSTYSESDKSNDGVDTITPQDKQDATWEDSMEFESAYQAGYMHRFFADTVGEWYNLLPRFDDTAYLKRDSGAFAVVASNSDNSKIVAYFYNFSDKSIGEKPNSTNGGTKTGTFGKLTPNATYNYQWFDPVNGKTIKTGKFTASANGTWSAGAKETRDMVLYIYK